MRIQIAVCTTSEIDIPLLVLPLSDIFYNFMPRQFQLNPFGDAPRMVKGTIVEDNVRWGFRNLFRRVTASFSSEGFGKDTLDISYRSRGSLQDDHYHCERFRTLLVIPGNTISWQEGRRQEYSHHWSQLTGTRDNRQFALCQPLLLTHSFNKYANLLILLRM